jgi:flagellar basal body-associated protein FliL
MATPQMRQSVSARKPRLRDEVRETLENPQTEQAAVHRKPKLLDQVRETMRRKHYSIRTEEAYIDWIK